LTQRFWDRTRSASISQGDPEQPAIDRVEGKSTSSIEEIIVTAQKRTESLQSVPISLTAFSDAQLERQDINGLADFARLVPSLSFQDQGASQGQITIRGIASAPVEGDEPKNKETVGVYFNEVPVATARFNPDLSLFDVERVEVLRGPQGTLYGSGSLAGTIKIVTKQPDLGKVDDAFGAGLGTTKDGDPSYKLDGMINWPVIHDKFAVRAVASTHYLGGFIDNLALNNDNFNDARVN
jgi:outer membrane receptor protein involved in Fe transport